MKKLLLLAMGCLLFTACKIELPAIVACAVGDVSPNGDLRDERELSPAQVKALTAWFSALHGDWKFEIVDNVPSGLMLVMKHKHDRTTRGNLRGDQLWIRNRFRLLSPTERDELLAIVSATQK